MHRWSFQRIVLWLAPVLLLLGVLCALLLARRAAGVSATAAEERALADWSVARTLVTDHVYGLQASTPAPLLKDSLWRILLAVAGWFTGSVQAAAWLLGALCAAGTLLVLLALARRLFPFPPFIYFAAALAVIMPGLATQALSGTSIPLAMLLATAAALAHVDGLQGRRRILPAWAAVFVGLLLWIRVEFAVLWLIFWVHALCMMKPAGAKGEGRRVAAVRGLSGLFVLALFMLPLVARNVRLLEVPWPQMPGAALSAQALAGLAPARMIGRSLALAWDVLPGLFASASGVPLLQNGLGRLYVWFGVILLGVLAGWRVGDRAHTLALFDVVLAPVFLALVIPFLGMDSATTVLGALGPMFTLAAAFGIFRAPFLAEQLYRKWKEGLPEAEGFVIWWALAGGVLLLVAVLSMGRFTSRSVREMADRGRVRESASRLLLSGRIPVRSAVTDLPGWMAFAHDLPILDLTGEFSPGLLTYVGEDGQWSREGLDRVRQEQKPDVAVLGGPDAEFLDSLLPETLERIVKESAPSQQVILVPLPSSDR